MLLQQQGCKSWGTCAHVECINNTFAVWNKKKRTSNRPLPSKIINWKNYQHSQRIAIICVTLIYTHWKSCQFYGVCGFYWDSLYVIPGHLWSICMKWKWSLTQSETRLHQNNLLFMKILTLLIVLAAVLFHYIPCWYGYTKCLFILTLICLQYF